jgi:hypothetical protein
MSGNTDNSENRKKLYFLFGFVGVILIAFIAVVFVSSYIGLLDDFHIPLLSDNNDKATVDPDAIYGDTSSANGVILTSMKKSVDAVTASGTGSQWLGSNPGWFTYNARADYVNSQGLAQHWTVTLRTDKSILVAVLNNGQVSDVTIYDLPAEPEEDVNDTGEIVEQYPAYNGTAIARSHSAYADIFDTGKAMSLAVKETGIAVPQTSMPFAVEYDNKGMPSTYTIYYTDAVTPRNSFVVQLDAVTGHILRSDRGVSQ